MKCIQTPSQVLDYNNFYQPIKTLKENVLKIVLNRVQGQRPNVDTVFEQINNKDGRITHIFMLLLSTLRSEILSMSTKLRNVIDIIAL